MINIEACAVGAIAGMLLVSVVAVEEGRIHNVKSEFAAHLALDQRNADAARAQVAQIDTKQADEVVKTDTSVKAKVTAIKAKTQTLIEKAPEYVPPEADGNCIVNLGSVVMYNSAVENTGAGDYLSDAAATAHLAYNSPSGVPLSTFVSVAVENVGIGQQAVARDAAWLEFYEGLRTAQGAK